MSDELVATLRGTFSKAGRAAFDSSLALVEKSAPPAAAPNAAPTVRATLQSDTTPASQPGVAAVDDEGPDAFEANRNNPHLARYMKRTGLSAQNVREHGSRTFNVVPRLGELADATATRR